MFTKAVSERCRFEKTFSYDFHRSTNGERDELMRGRGRELMTNSTRYHSFMIIVVTEKVQIVLFFQYIMQLSFSENSRKLSRAGYR